MTTTTRPKWYDEKLVAYAGLIARLARVYGGRQHDEVAQDIYLDAINRWDRYVPDQYSFAMWLKLCARNVASKRKQYRMAQMRRADVCAFDEAYTMSAQPTQHEAMELADTVRHLTGRNGQILLRVASGEFMHDIGEEMGISKQRVEQIVRQERAALHKRMGVRAAAGMVVA